MTDRDRGLRFAAPNERELRYRLYRALAAELSTSATPAAIVVESSTTRQTPEVSVRPAQAVSSTLATFRTLRTACGPAVPYAPSLPGRPARIWALTPVRPRRVTAPLVDAWAAPALLPLLGSRGRIAVQTFWVSGRSDGQLWTCRRVRLDADSREELEGRAPGLARWAAAEWSRASGVVCSPQAIRPGANDWAVASARSLSADAWVALTPATAARTVEASVAARPTPVPSNDGHTIALGASGAGKTTLLADQAARSIRRGRAVFAVDLHGDLAPAIVAQLSPVDRGTVVGVDVTRRPVTGIAVLAGTGDRAAAQFVAAVKRLSPDGTDMYWGFRLERIFDAFVRIVQESGGGLADLYALLTDPDRRDAARLATRSPELARFLEELGPIVRRTPEFLWSAAARLSKVVLVPELAELLSPADGGVPVEEILTAGRSILVRIPFASVGPEAAAFAGSLILARAYLGLAGREGPVHGRRPVLVVLDEAQALAPRLVAEMLTEGRKFGLRVMLASQYPERLAPDLRLAAAGVSRHVVAFRAPRASAAGVGSWVGLGPADAERSLPDLPVGFGVTRLPGSGELRTLLTPPAPSVPGDELWDEVARRSAGEFPPTPSTDLRLSDDTTERLLLAILAAEERGSPVEPDRLATDALTLPGPAIDPAILEDRVGSLPRLGLAHVAAGAWHLTPSGERRLGLTATTGASRESAEHRRLLLRTFRLFARHGHLLEIVRQGRFDTTLPDAIYRQIPERRRSASPPELANSVASAQRQWAWRFFGGCDVHVEAEVSGALRPSRIRHGLEKARRRGAFALFVVGDAGRASRVRRTLRADGWGPDRAQVWTLPGVRSEATGVSQDGKAPDGCPGP